MLRGTSVRCTLKLRRDAGSRAHQGMYPGHYDKGSPRLRPAEWLPTAALTVAVAGVALLLRGAFTEGAHGAVDESPAFAAQAAERAEWWRQEEEIREQRTRVKGPR